MIQRPLIRAYTFLKPPKSLAPMHVGIILDGNRRYARKRNLDPWKGHQDGARNVQNMLGWAKDLGVTELSLYCFSLENFGRTSLEVEFLMKLFSVEFKRLLESKELHDIQARVRFIGRREKFNNELQELILQLEERTKEYQNYTLNFIFGYTGRDEIVQASMKLALKAKLGEIEPQQITEEDFRKELLLQSYPELIIRTSGEQRISGFLLWQAAYSEFYFSPKMWPEFTKEDLEHALNNYKSRERRYGK